MKVSGWLKDKYDPKDYLYRTLVPEVLPTIIDLSEYLPRDKNGYVQVRDQGTVGSCTGHGIGVNLCSIISSLGIWSMQAYEWFSPTWIYNGARYLEGTLAFDLGAYPKDCCEWLLANGTLLEQYWPYDPSKLDKTPPGETRRRLAVRYKNFAYQRAVDGVNGILSALNDGHFVSLGAPWPDKWCSEEVASTGILPEVTADDFSNNGHETCIFKADQSTHQLFGINSWGSRWGGSFGIAGAIGGFYAMPFSAIEAFKGAGGYDGHIITFDKDLEVETVPVDDKKGCLLKTLFPIFA